MLLFLSLFFLFVHSQTIQSETIDTYSPNDMFIVNNQLIYARGSGSHNIYQYDIPSDQNTQKGSLSNVVIGVMSYQDQKLYIGTTNSSYTGMLVFLFSILNQVQSFALDSSLQTICFMDTSFIMNTNGYIYQVDYQMNQLLRIDSGTVYSIVYDGQYVYFQPTFGYVEKRSASSINQVSLTFGGGDPGTVFILVLNGGYLYAGSSDHTAKQWDTSTGQLIKTFSQHTNYIYGVAVSSGFLFTGSWDKNWVQWNLTDGSIVREQNVGGTINFVQLSGMYLFTGASNGILKFAIPELNTTSTSTTTTTAASTTTTTSTMTTHTTSTLTSTATSTSTHTTTSSSTNTVTHTTSGTYTSSTTTSHGSTSSQIPTTSSHYQTTTVANTISTFETTISQTQSIVTTSNDLASTTDSVTGTSLAAIQTSSTATTTTTTTTSSPTPNTSQEKKLNWILNLSLSLIFFFQGH